MTMTKAVRCPRCNTFFREIDTEVAASLYERLKPYLSVVPSFGCYTPKRNHGETGDHTAWPLHFWRGPGHFPVVVQWGKAGVQPTFTEFCQVYGLQLTAP